MELRQKILGRISTIFAENFSNWLDFVMVTGEEARVTEVTDLVLTAKGFDQIFYNELVIVADRYSGLVATLEDDIVKIILLEKTQDIMVGSPVRRTGQQLSVGVSENLVGRVLDGLGRPLDGKKLPSITFLPVERPAMALINRRSVTEPLQTGLKVVDALIPIGKGQRELILGDRQTGKTTLALDAILHQKEQKTICIYCSIGQRDNSVAQLLQILQENHAMDYTLVLQAGASEIAGHQFITPYTATTIGEFFRERGKDVLIVYDDLTKHARAYREISLLLGRNPGREAYPADIFYVHSRLLERSGSRRWELGGGSLTALPIVETEADNMSAYISTNIISITDGQIYLNSQLLHSGFLPAVDISKSVSRVGNAAQTKTYRQAIGTLGINYSQFEELEAFSKFSINLDPEVEKILQQGYRIKELFRQKIHRPLGRAEQIGIFLCLNNNLFITQSPEKMEEMQKIVLDILRDDMDGLKKALETDQDPNTEAINSFLAKVKNKLGV